MSKIYNPQFSFVLKLQFILTSFFKFEANALAQTYPGAIAWQLYMYGAVRQYCSLNGKSVLPKVYNDSGHFELDLKEIWVNFANQYAFMMRQCGHMDSQKKENRPQK
ncbi:MAG: hypothetical protein IPJ54_20640 [Saprospiraceae bacterium]|nr:hypothetical protein [Saprospiraceae bacterium]